MGDKPIPRWQKILVGLYALAWVAFIALDWHRFVDDFWPIDKSSVGPNLVASVVQYTALAILLVLIWPPTRRRIHHFVDAKVDGVKTHISGHFTAMHERHDAHAQEIAELHRKLDHLIHHSPKVPDLPPKDVDVTP